MARSIVSTKVVPFQGMLAVQLRKESPTIAPAVAAPVANGAEGHTLHNYSKVFFRYEK